MPRSVYSSTGHGKLSRLNPIKLVTRFVAIAMVMSIALLGTATMASAVAIGTPAFTPTNAASAVGGATSASYTVTATTVTAPTGTGNFVITFPIGYTVPAVPTVTTTTNTTIPATCVLTGATTGTAVTAPQVVTVTLSGTCSPTAGVTTLVVAGVTNPAAGIIAAAGFHLSSSAETDAPATVAVTLGTPLVAPTVAGNGTGAATVSFAADGISTTYTVTTSDAGSPTICAPITGGTVGTVGATQTCAITGLTNGSADTFTVTPSGGTPASFSTAKTSTAFTVGALGAPTLARAGSGAVKVTFVADGTATLYTVTSSPASAGCTVAGTIASPPSGSQFCYVTGLTNGTSYTFTVTPSGNSTTSTASAASAALVPAVSLATPTAINISTTQSRVFFTADGVATTYTVSGVTNTADTCSVSATPATASGTALSCVVTDITDTFIVTPNAGDLSSIASLASNATVSSAKLGASPATDGGKPTSKLAGAGAATVTWVSDGVASLYTVNLVDTTSGTRDATKTLGAGGSTAVAAGPQSLTFTGLTTGDVINFTVTASGNGTGLTTTSAASSPNLTVSNALATPSVANSGTGAVLVSFVADGVAATYTVSNASGGTVGAFTCTISNTTTVPTGAQSCTVSGLASGTAYTFIVTPSNGGTSGASAASSSVTTVTALATPTIGSAPSGSVVVDFTADGVASTYTVTSTPGNFTCTVINTTTAPTGAQHCTVTGLTNGTSYTFTVTPSGNADTAAVSLKSAAAVAGSALATPTAVSASAGTATVSFVADGVAGSYLVQSNLALTPFTAGPTCTVANTTTANWRAELQGDGTYQRNGLHLHGDAEP